MDEIRQAFTEGNQEKAEMLTRQNFNSEVSYDADGETPFRFGSFTTMGEFYVETGLNIIGMSDYKRILSLDSAMAVVQFKKDHVAYQRNYFISYPANVMVMRFSADQPGKQKLGFSVMRLIRCLPGIWLLTVIKDWCIPRLWTITE